MLPVTLGLKKAAQITFLFNAAAIACSLTLPVLGLAGMVYSAVAVSAGSWFMFESRNLLVSPSETLGFRVFLASMPYLGLLMVGLVIDRLFFARIL